MTTQLMLMSSLPPLQGQVGPHLSQILHLSLDLVCSPVSSLPGLSPSESSLNAQCCQKQRLVFVKETRNW